MGRFGLKRYSEKYFTKELYIYIQMLCGHGRSFALFPSECWRCSDCGKRTFLFWVKLIQTQTELGDLKQIRPSNMNFINSNTNPLHTFS